MWEQIRANRRRSALLISGMVGVLLLIGYAGGELLIGAGGGIIGLGLALVIWGVLMGVYYTAAESILLRSAGARPIQREDSPRLFNIVDEMKIASGLPFTPRIYLIDESSPNAFAFGRKPETSGIAVTTGLMHRLNRDELQGVVAHEIGHLRNRDVQFMTLAAVLLGSIIVLSDLFRRMMWFGGGRGRRRSDSRGGGGGGQAQAILMIVALLFVILGPVMAQLLYFACSRKREYLADASAAQFTRYPEGLAAALEKIVVSRGSGSFASRVTAPMFIVNPLAGRGAGRSGLFSTHPPTEQRIRVLRRMAGASLADYEQSFRESTGKGVIGSRSLGEAQASTIRAASEKRPVATRKDAREIVYRSYGYIQLRCDCGLEMSVPERYERNDIHCVRCGSVLPLPAVQEVVDAAFAQANAQATRQPPPVLPAGSEPPLSYTRTGAGWESFRCRCGRTVQLSPAFRAPQVKCGACRRRIQIV